MKLKRQSHAEVQRQPSQTYYKEFESLSVFEQKQLSYAENSAGQTILPLMQQNSANNIAVPADFMPTEEHALATHGIQSSPHHSRKNH